MAPSSRRRAAAAAAADATTTESAIEVESAPIVAPSSPPPPPSDSSKPAAELPAAASGMQKKVSMLLVALAVLLLLYRIFAAFSGNEPIVDNDDKDGSALSVKRVVSAETTTDASKKPRVTLEQSGWSPQIGSLVEKRPPRQCTKTEIAPQMFDLLVYRTKKGPTARRAFACLAAKCRDAIIEDALDRQWKQVKQGSVDATFVFTDFASIAKLPPAQFAQLYFSREGSTYLDVVFGGLAFNTLDAFEQFSHLQTYTKQFGCEMNDLQVMAPQFRNTDERECLDLKSQAQKQSRAVFSIVGTAGTLSSEQLLAKLGDCSAAAAQQQLLVQKPLGKLMLLNSKDKFTVRAFCLVGSTMPYMVFYRRGYVVVTDTGKTVSLEQFQRTLANNKITGTHFIDTFLQTSMKQIALFVFQAARPHFLRRRGSFQLFALDFVVTDEMKIYLQSTDPQPKMPQNVVTDMLDLVMELGEEPGAFARMLTGDKYGSFELIFSELRETCEGASSFNPCQQFKQYNTQNLAKANKKISVTHNAFNREHHEETRVIKKLEEEKKAACKLKGFSLESKACDRYAKTLEDEEFEVLFAQHEKDWNPNAFKLAQPGEVFPWEIV